jgi:hypothetical protein
MTSINVYKGFSVHRTATLSETAEWLTALCDKLDREIKKGHLPPMLLKGEPVDGNGNGNGSNSATPNAENTMTAGTEQPYCSVVKKVKKDNITPANIGEIILCQLPGISSVTAVAVMKKFPTFSALMEEMKANPACLDGLTYEQNGKARKVNKTSIENIKTYLLS